MKRDGLDSSLARLVGRMLLGAAIAVCGIAVEAPAEIYYYQDADGVFHFSNVAQPNSLPFDLKPAEQAEAERPQKPRQRQRLGVIRHDAKQYDELIREISAKLEVEPALVKAVIRAESNFNTKAISNKGARGLMQLMPYTARLQKVERVHDPADNIRGGVEYLRFLLKRYNNNVPLSLAAYHAGHGPVDRHRAIPPIESTRTYVSRVLTFRREYLRQEQLAAN